MSYFALPKITTDYELKSVVECRTDGNHDTVINRTLNIYLNTAKAQIDSRQVEWDRFKKYTNPYEYIHTPVPSAKTAVCKLRPLSRSFYKMIEITKTMRLLDFTDKTPIKTFHFAEGPGGFIEATAYMRDNSDDRYHGMSLINDEDSSIPGWKKSKSFLDKNPNVTIERGATGNGDMLEPDNLKHCFENHQASVDLATADGGFDFTTDFNHQEVMSLRLMFAQAAFAIATQKVGGSFVMKVFDTVKEASVDILYILASVYEQVFFIKPNTSRQANSERYVVCKNFKLPDSKGLVISMYHVLQAFREGAPPTRFLAIPVPYLFTSALQEINAIYGQAQIECISQTLNLMTSAPHDRIENLKKAHITRCLNWCTKFRMPYNKVNISANIFLAGRSSNNDTEDNSTVDGSNVREEGNDESDDETA